jgi:hypothetical protein
MKDRIVRALGTIKQAAAPEREIDRMLHELYGLTEEEIMVVEGERVVNVH